MTLHITNGDCAADTLRLIVSDPVTITADVLHEGPCPPIDGEAWRDVRARFLAAGGGATYDEVKATLDAWDQPVVDACHRGDDIVLWFEHDLFDQLALIRTLDLMVRLKPDTTEVSATDPRATGPRATGPRATGPRATDPRATGLRATGLRATGTRAAAPAPVVSGFSRTSPHVSLICIDRFPGVERFIGLGQLTAAQLATLNGTGVPVTAGHFRLATDTWRAFRSPDPAGLLEITLQLSAARTPVSEGGAALRFLGDALLRFLAEFPSVAHGLSRTEDLALNALLDGPTAAGVLFGATQAREARPFMGDRTFFGILEQLASARVPLVTIDTTADEGDQRAHTVAITSAGRDVLAGRADHVRLNGIDLWRGGIHLTGSDRSPWRWDAHNETLVS